MRPQCFVLVPFGRKADQTGQIVDFDLVYFNLIVPAMESAGIGPVRRDDLSASEPVTRPLFERLLISDYVLADLSAGSPDVYYDLGIRHALHRSGTILIAREGIAIPFDVAAVRVFRYHLNDFGRPENTKAFVDHLLRSAREESPVYQVLNLDPPKASVDELARISIERTDRGAGAGWKRRISQARFEGTEELRRLESEMTNVAPEVLLELFKAYRLVGAWAEAVALADRLPPSVAASPTVQEQLAMALNRTGQAARAEAILHGLLRNQGPSSETYGMLGRVYKDKWRAATDNQAAREALNLAIDSYVKGFEADWRDFYPGINALTLMDIRGESDSRIEEMVPVVRYAVKRKLAKTSPEYWPLATLLELEVLANSLEAAGQVLAQIDSTNAAGWQRESTAHNLRLIRGACERRDSDTLWIAAIEKHLSELSGGHGPDSPDASPE